MVAVAGCVAGIGFPAYTAMTPDLVPAEDLLGAVSLGQAQYNLGRVVGPALAGIAISLGSYTWAFAINTVSFGAMLLAVRALRLPPPPPLAEGQERESLVVRIVVGAKAARREPGVRFALAWLLIRWVPGMARLL